MNPTTRRNLSTAALIILALAAGCGGHYRVTDPASGKAYFTRDVDRGREGTVQFKDARSGSRVTLTSSEVQEISRKEYKAAVEAR